MPIEIKVRNSDIGLSSKNNAGVAVGIKGAKGDKGDKGEPFKYEDFTPEQLEALRGKDYVITDADYEAIAALVKVEGSGYDDTEIREELLSVTGRVDDLETEVGNSSLLLSLI